MSSEKGGEPERIVAYLKEVRRYLQSVDRNTRNLIITDIQDIIKSKLQKYNDAGKKDVDAEAQKKMIKEIGTPSEVVSHYFESMPIKPSALILAFFIFQGSIAGITLYISANSFYGNSPWYTLEGIDASLTLEFLLLATCWTVLGIILFVTTLLQLRRSSLIVEYGFFSTIVSLILAIGAILLITNPFLDNFKPEDMVFWNYIFYGPMFIAALVIHLLGLRLVQSYQAIGIIGSSDDKFLKRWEKSGRPMILATAIVISLLIISSGFLTYYISKTTHEPDRVGMKLISSDYVGGPNNATIEFYSGYVTDRTGYGYNSECKIVYQSDGMRVEGSFDPDMVPVLEWIMNNTEQNATIVAWWDYGHSIRGYTGRNVIAVNPSKSLYPNTLWRPEDYNVFDSDQKIADLSSVLIGDNENQTKEVMGKYNASYILTTSRDLGISYAMFQGAKKDTWVYLDKTFWPTEKGKETFLYKTWMGEGFGDFKLEYKDLTTRIYSI